MSDEDVYTQQPVALVRRPAPAAAQVRPSNLSTLIARIEEVIDVETAAIRSDVGFDLKGSNARKSRYLYDLNRAVKDLPRDALLHNRDGIVRLRGKLAANEAAIAAHLSAVTEVAGLIQDAIQRSEADGTYSSGAFAQPRGL